MATSHDVNVYRSWQDPRQRVPSVLLSYLQALRQTVEKTRAGEFASARAFRLFGKVKRRVFRHLEGLAMFDDDDLFDLTDDPFEWDMLLDDDELERDRKKRKDKNAQGDASKKNDKRRRGLFGGLFG